MLPGELAAGTPSNLGKIGDAGKSTLTFRLARYLVESFSALADAALMYMQSGYLRPASLFPDV